MLQDDARQQVVLVDENDRQIGVADKLAAHRNGALLHRAFSIFIFNSKGQTMLQKRALGKYHSEGKWSNTCCSHPMVGESVLAGAHRRLKEEMGFDCNLSEMFSFTYKADVGNGFTEWEYDHVIFGIYDGEPKLNKQEASDYSWVNLDDLKADIERNPEKYTPWLRICIAKVVSAYGTFAKNNGKNR
ncbi:MAG: isopentenyl-diphosphate Delta-isomerase [Candidatus Micrarchaeaceae archaeon]